MKFIIKPRFTRDRTFTWQTYGKGVRSIDKPSVPMLEHEADTFRDMVKRGVRDTSDAAKSYQIRDNI